MRLAVGVGSMVAVGVSVAVGVAAVVGPSAVVSAGLAVAMSLGVAVTGAAVVSVANPCARAGTAGVPVPAAASSTRLRIMPTNHFLMLPHSLLGTYGRRRWLMRRRAAGWDAAARRWRARTGRGRTDGGAVISPCRASRRRSPAWSI